MTAAVHGRSPILNQAGAAISGDTFFLPGLSLQDSSRMRAGGTAPEITTHRFRAGENGGNLGWEFGWEPRGESQDPLDDSENTRHYRNAFPCGPVAQLGEHMVCNHGVGSSNLPRSTKSPCGLTDSEVRFSYHGIETFHKGPDRTCGRNSPQTGSPARRFARREGAGWAGSVNSAENALLKGDPPR